MRSIGKVKIKKLKALVKETAKDFEPLSMTSYQLSDAVKHKIPDYWYDTWEGAWAEIEGLVSDFINDLK